MSRWLFVLRQYNDITLLGCWFLLFLLNSPFYGDPENWRWDRLLLKDF